MDILTRMRGMTPESLAGTRTDFDDAPVPVYRSKAPKEMTRIVEGADDLKVNRPRPAMPGMVKSQDWSGEQLTDMYEAADHDDDGCPKPCCRPTTPEVRDARSPRQVELMAGLHMQLAELDAKVAEDAVAYTTRMTVAGRWTPGMDGNASDWIKRMISKVRQLRNVTPRGSVDQVYTSGPVEADNYDSIPKGYYALHHEDAEIKFYRVTKWQGRTYVKVQAGPELHPIQNATTRKAILDAIVSVGWEASTALYGQKIGRCGRCRRSLTDADSRARGIGPDCWGKM